MTFFGVRFSRARELLPLALTGASRFGPVVTMRGRNPMTNEDAAGQANAAAGYASDAVRKMKLNGILIDLANAITHLSLAVVYLTQ